MTGTAERLGPRLLALGAGALWAYTCVVFLYQERVAGVGFGAALAGGTLALGCAGIAFAASRPAVRRALTPGRMLNIGVALLSATGAILIADTAAGVLANRRAGAEVADPGRSSDPHLWHGELFPRQYYPTSRNFFLYKPDVRLSADTYGEYYTAPMQRSPTLRDSVLGLHHLAYHIGPDGLRELEPLTGSRVFALGDSYALGYSTDEGKTWTDRLGATLGEPVYNMGLSSTGPRPQLELLAYMLEHNRDSMTVRDLLWMIYEGNDLENSYAELRPATESPGGGSGALLDGTLPGWLAELPGRIKAQSAVRRLLRGELVLGRRGRSSSAGGVRRIDGVTLATPLYHSPRWGYMLFNPDDVERATKPLAYVQGHPNRPRLDRTFRDMRALAERQGFRVTVILAPTAARLYGADFEGFPTPSSEPWFLHHVGDLARSVGFEVVDLSQLMRPAAARELLYYRDDHHWNERGNEVAAQLIAEALRARLPAPGTGPSR